MFFLYLSFIIDDKMKKVGKSPEREQAYLVVIVGFSSVVLFSDAFTVGIDENTLVNFLGV